MGLVSGPRLATPAARANGHAARELWGVSSPYDLIPIRPLPAPGTPSVNADTALRHSAVWACLRLRNDLISTMPIDVFRRVDTLQVKTATPQVLITPDGDADVTEWMYSTGFDLDRAGNVVGIIRAWDGNGLPQVIELAPTAQVTIRLTGWKITSYLISGTTYLPREIWHEKQFTAPGIPIGLSPVAYAAMTLGRYMSIEKFAADWFAGGGVPRARLRNTAKKLDQREALIVKESWRASISAGEPFVHGSDWEYDLIQAAQTSLDWLDAQQASVLDVARWFGCPGDLIEAHSRGGGGAHITYANITQKHLQLLVLNLGPAITRREKALSKLTLNPRYVKINRNAILAMDPLTRANYYKQMIDCRAMTPDEARALEEQPPLTAEQIDQFLTFWPPRGSVLAGGPEEIAPPAIAPPA